MAVVVPYDTAGKDVYKLLHMMAFDHAPGAKLNEEIDYFEEIKRASDLMTDQEKEIIDKKVRNQSITGQLRQQAKTFLGKIDGYNFASIISFSQ